MRSLLKKWLGDRRGTTAVEFGMIAPAFIALLFGSAETGWLMTKSVMLDTALERSIRLVRIGGAGAPTTHDALRKSVCESLTIVRNCERDLLIEMTVVKSPSSFPTSAVQCVNRAKPEARPTFTTGGRSDMMFVRACLTVDPILPLVAAGMNLPRTPAGTYTLVGVSGFMNEPGV